MNSICPVSYFGRGSVSLELAIAVVVQFYCKNSGTIEMKWGKESNLNINQSPGRYKIGANYDFVKWSLN